METIIVDTIRKKFNSLSPFLDERTRRLWAGAEANALGRGGKVIVAEATGVSRVTIDRGIRELCSISNTHFIDRIRVQGGGRKRVQNKIPEIMDDLKILIEGSTGGDPESPLLWTCKSTRQLENALRNKGYVVGRQKISELLDELGYSLQGNRKSEEGNEHPDRDAQFRFINRRVKIFQRFGQPVISVDTKKKELIGNFANKGKEWEPKGNPRKVDSHDFGNDRVNPYGVYDQTRNLGWINVGTDNDTAEFAVESIRRWWEKMGNISYPRADNLLVTADCGGSNGYRVRLWKVALQKLSNETGLKISVCHFPPGTSKWNKIEHRLFCHISMNWRGKPLVSYDVVVNLIGSTTTREGLTVQAVIDSNVYPKEKKVTVEEVKNIEIRRSGFHGEWNYKIMPKCTS